MSEITQLINKSLETKQNFVHLRTYSSYSLLEGAITVQNLVAKALSENMPALAITDRHNLFASLEFSKEAVKYGIQPIIGCTFDFDSEIEDNSFATKSKQTKNDQILLIAKNKIGYQNLLKIASSYHDNKSGESILTFGDLKKLGEGIIILTSGINGTLGRLLLGGKNDTAEKFLLELNSYFTDHIYIEITRHGFQEEERIESQLIDLGLKHNIPFVATNDVYFLDQSMHEAHEVLLCISEGKYISEDDRRTSCTEYCFKSQDEMEELFSDLPEAIENTIKIAKRCSVKSEERKIMFPHYKVSLGNDEPSELSIIAHQGLDKRLEFMSTSGDIRFKNTQTNDDVIKQYKDRLDYELEIIIKMGFAGYFLIVSDFIGWAKSHKIPVGPGRGSGAGSVVSWSLNITDVDPIKFGLFFERFLNPERVSPPDLDIDFCQDRRDEVIKYVQQKYGMDKVAHIITFGKLQAKAAIRDVGRVLQLPYSLVDKVAKMVPFNAVNPITLGQAIEIEPELKKAQKNDPDVAKLLNISLKLEGLHRHASTHAAGVIISAHSLETLVPMYKKSKSGMPVIQYSMKHAEAAGLIKFDFLGLKTLTVISNCQKSICKSQENFDIHRINFSDPATFKMLAAGQSIGVFQFESSGMKSSLAKMKPDSIEDIIALGALYRPGPMDNIPTYIACKHGISQPDYLHPLLENVLDKTFGVIIYQEQVMEIARILGGYSSGEADLLRRAMGKKIKEEMDDQREKFVNGAIDNGIKKDRAIYIFDLVAKFAGYGFPKAHAAAYGIISYYTAYLKANYPAQMIVSILNTEIYDTDKINIFIQEAKSLGIGILPPDINSSLESFSVVLEDGKEKILYALGAIKNISFDAMVHVVKTRNDSGKYKDIFDVIAKSDNKINKRQIEYLIKAGVFDSISNNRKQLFDSIDIILTHKPSTSNKDQLSLFAEKSFGNAKLADSQDWNKNERLNHECSAIGLYISDHPLDPYSSFFSDLSVVDAAYIKDKIESGVHNIKLAAIPVVIKNRFSPRGRYVIISSSTPSGIIDITVFDDAILEKNRDSIYSKKPMLFTLEVRKDNDFERITATSITDLDCYFYNQKIAAEISITTDKHLNSIKDVIVDNKKSNHEITIRVNAPSGTTSIRLPKKYSLNFMANDFDKISNIIVKQL